MTSVRATIANYVIVPLLGIKRFFADPDRLPERIAKLRKRPSPRPSKKLRKRLAVREDDRRGYAVVTMEPVGGARSGAPHIIYLHGGGYVMDIVPQHYETVARLCERLGASASVPVYPLAPENKADAILASMLAFYRECAERYGAQNIVMMGDSAGGGMALALAQMLRSSGDALPGRLVLFSPWLDATASDPAQAAIEPRDKMLAQVGLLECGELYRGDLSADDPRISPLFGPLDGLPPIAIFAGTRDILLVDARRLAERLSGIGVDHAYYEYPGMFHVWMLLDIPEARDALEKTARFIEETMQ